MYLSLTEFAVLALVLVFKFKAKLIVSRKGVKFTFHNIFAAHASQSQAWTHRKTTSNRGFRPQPHSGRSVMKIQNQWSMAYKDLKRSDPQ